MNKTTYDYAISMINSRRLQIALEQLMPLAEQGDAQAQFELGLRYEQGDCVAQDYTEAMKWLRLSAEQGNAEAQYGLGKMYKDGLGVAQDYPEAMKWFKKAAEKGHMFAQGCIRTMYEKGLGVPQDRVLAQKLFKNIGPWKGDAYLNPLSAQTQTIQGLRKNAEQGNAEAQYELGLVFSEKQFVPEDIAEAAKWFKLSAEQGNVGAQLQLSIMRLEGLGMQKDDAEAAKWLINSAEQGNFEAQVALTYFYYCGIGLPTDYVEAHKWCTVAAEDMKNNDQRTDILSFRGTVAGMMTQVQIQEAKKLASEFKVDVYLRSCDIYLEHHGLQLGGTEAMKRILEYARRGNIPAQFKLSHIYAEGLEGMPKDHVEAHKWCCIAVEGLQSKNVRGDLVAAGIRINDVCEKILSFRGTVAGMMSQMQIQEAQERARKWKGDRQITTH